MMGPKLPSQLSCRAWAYPGELLRYAISKDSDRIRATEVSLSGVDDYPLDAEPVWNVTADVFVN